MLLEFLIFSNFMAKNVFLGDWNFQFQPPIGSLHGNIQRDFRTTSDSHMVSIIGSNEAARVLVDACGVGILNFLLWLILWPKCVFGEIVIFIPYFFLGEDSIIGQRLSFEFWSHPTGLSSGGATVKLGSLFCVWWNFGPNWGEMCCRLCRPDDFTYGSHTRFKWSS